MFGWLQKKGKEKQIKNIHEDLAELIEVSNIADAYISENGNTSEKNMEKVVNAQKKLLFSFLGPLEIPEIEALIENIKQQLHISGGAEMAIQHVIDTFKKDQGK